MQVKKRVQNAPVDLFIDTDDYEAGNSTNVQNAITNLQIQSENLNGLQKHLGNMVMENKHSMS